MATDEEVDLRIDLIREELNELEEACDKGTLVDVADWFSQISYMSPMAQVILLELGSRQMFCRSPRVQICPSWERMENRCIVKMERS